MKLFCINLDRRPDRLAHMGSQFAKHDLEFTRIPAIDGSDPNVIQQSDMAPSMWNGLRMSSGAFACLQSHRLAWKLLTDSGDRYAIIFEDDVILAEGISGFRDETKIPRNADIVKLETFGTRVHLDRSSVSSLSNRSLHRLRSSHVGAGAYIISRNAAEKLYRMTGSSGNPVDEEIFNDGLSFFKSGVIYQVVPAPAIQGLRAARISHSGDFDIGWSASSLDSRVVGRSGDEVALNETTFNKYRRRIFEETSSVFRRTKYVVVPWG